MAKATISLVIFAFALLASTSLYAGKSKKPILWRDLNAKQQVILAPLAPDWDTMGSISKEKWLGIAKRYPKMKIAEQGKVRRRILEWAGLTVQERQGIRDKYRKLKALTFERQQTLPEAWKQYQQLSETERELLRTATKGLSTKIEPADRF